MHKSQNDAHISILYNKYVSMDRSKMFFDLRKLHARLRIFRTTGGSRVFLDAVESVLRTAEEQQGCSATKPEAPPAGISTNILIILYILSVIWSIKSPLLFILNMSSTQLYCLNIFSILNEAVKLIFLCVGLVLCFCPGLMSNVTTKTTS